MKELTGQVKVGITGESFAGRAEAEELGFVIKETDVNVYAVKDYEAVVNENMDEYLESYTEETLLEWLQEKEGKLQYDREYNSARSILQKKVPADVKKLLAGWESLGIDVEAIPFEVLTDKQTAIEYVKNSM